MAGAGRRREGLPVRFDLCRGCAGLRCLARRWHGTLGGMSAALVLPRACLLALLAGTAAGANLAQERSAATAGPSLFVDGGPTAHDGHVVGLGLRWPSGWQAQRWGAQWSLATDLSLRRWSASLAQGRDTTLQLALAPVLRWRPDAGRSAWFVEGGIGLSLHDSRYERDGQRMSTRWNFQDMLGVGRSLGERQELSLWLVHVSNAGLRKPNPGEEMLLLRWSMRL